MTALLIASALGVSVWFLIMLVYDGAEAFLNRWRRAPYEPFTNYIHYSNAWKEKR